VATTSIFVGFLPPRQKLKYATMSFIWDLFTNYQTQIISLLVTILVTGGASFLFHPAILVYYHEDIDHSTKLLKESTKKEKDSQVLLSLVIPAYNEEDRLTVMLDECYEYLSQKDCPSLKTLLNAYQNANKTKNIPETLVEWIVISDGSSDQTCQIFEQYVQKLKTPDQPFLWKLVSLPINEGKGAAVQVGMTEATGYYRLMVDADGATTFDQGLEAVSKAMLESTIHGSPPQQTIIFGSRSGDGAKRSALRQFLMHSFLWLRSCVVGTPVSLRDTQCGFKLFDQPSAVRLFSNLHLRRWAFDIELVYVALSLNMAIKEVTVPWHEVDGSKLNTGFFALVRVSIGMLRDMCCVRACYVLGIWKIRNKL
jgi:dolichyl-phosphate beta-glucosyltransferase